ncbi:MAG: hypothetical protein M0P69_19490 [Bacteroidales bacterium]|nr:hypothetical protein [Bacteroidales bacterium]
MKCKNCPAYQVDGFSICLLEHPDVPEQLADPNSEADYCQLWEDYQKNSQEKEKEQNNSGKSFELKEAES